MEYTTIAVREDFKQDLKMLQLTDRKKSMEELLKAMLEEYKKNKEKS